MKQLIATIIVAGIAIANAANAQQYKEPAKTGLRQEVDQWVKDIERKLAAPHRTPQPPENKQLAALDRFIQDLHYLTKVTDKNGELSVQVIKTMALANRQAEWFENHAADSSHERCSEGYRRGAQICRQRATNMQSLLKNIHEVNARCTDLLAEFQEDKELYFAMLVIGEICLANEHFKKVSQSMDAAIQELEDLGKMKLQQAQTPVTLQR